MVSRLVTIILLACSIFGVKKLYYDNYECDRFKVTSTGKYHVIEFFTGNTDFEVSTKKKGNFYVNANFFTPEERVIGGLIINGASLNSQIKGGGSFVVKNGRPSIAFNRIRGCEYLTQSIIWAMRNGRINSRALLSASSKNKAARVLIGKTQDGRVIVIHSNQLIYVTLSEIFNFAKDHTDLIDAIVLDGGTSVDIGLEWNGYVHRMKSVPSYVKRLMNISEPKTYIIGKFR